MDRQAPHRSVVLLCAVLSLFSGFGSCSRSRPAADSEGAAKGDSINAASREAGLYSIRSGGSELLIECRTSSNGILLVPAGEAAEFFGYDSWPCEHCGDTQLSSRDAKKAAKDGLVLVKWFEPVAYRSARKGAINLRAPTERIDGNTWVDISLFSKLGHRVETIKK